MATTRRACRHRLWLGCCGPCDSIAYLTEYLDLQGAAIRRRESLRLTEKAGRR